MKRAPQGALYVKSFWTYANVYSKHTFTIEIRNFVVFIVTIGYADKGDHVIAADEEKDVAHGFFAFYVS
jgi:hypothetical protein